jgi:protein-disulfide isomerase-like protein with CxxC motif
MDSSPEKMRELYRMQAELNLEQAKLRTFEDFAAQANQEIGPGENYVGGAAYRTGSTTNDKFRRDGQTGAEARDQVIRESTAAMGKVYVGFYDEAVKTGQERYATADDSTKRILERRIIDPITGDEMSYLDYEAQTIALKKTADQDPASYGTFSRRREELLAPIDQTGALIQNQKLVDDGIKYGTRLNKRDLAEAKAVPLREDIRDLTRKRDDAFEGGALAEGKKYQEQIYKATAKVEEITYTDAEWDAIPEAARYLVMSAEEVMNMTAAEIRFAADATLKEMQNPTDYKREAKNFWDGTMDRNFQRRQQRVDTTLTAFARQSIMGLGEQTASNLTGVNEDKSSGNAGLVMDNTPEARAVRMAQRSGLMPRNRAGQEDTVEMVTAAQRAAVAEQLDIGRTNRQVALANAPEAQLYKSGFTNFMVAMIKAGATAEDLGRSFMNTMNLMSEGNPRYGLDLAQQMTGFSYEAMIGMQLRPRTGVDAEGNPISSLNGANGIPYGYNAKPGEIISGPMVMPYTSGPRGTIAYSRDMMAVNAQGVRENALGIAPSQWQQFVSNATNANAELQRRAMSNAIQERDLNKNHQRNLEDIARNGMRQLESIHLNYTRNMQQLTMQADLVKGTTRANAARSIAMAAIDPTRKDKISSQYWAQDRYFQHIGQGDSVNFLKDSSNIAAITAIDPSLSADISALETTNAAYENSAITDPNRQDLQDAKRATIEPILTKLRGLIETETDPIKRASLQKALVQLSPDASRTIAGQNENDKWLKQNLGDAITETQLGQQISDQEFQNKFRPLDIANDAASGAEAARSQDPLALLNYSRSSETMYRGFGQADKALNDTKNSLAGLIGTAHMFEETSQTAIGQIAAGIGSATQSVLYSVDDFETSFQQQMEDALRNFERQRLDMIQAFADAAVEIASIVPEEMIPIMQATSAFMNTQRQAELLWLSGRTDEANELAYQGMLKLGEVVYGEGKGKAYADKYSQNFEEMADVAARDVPQGDLGKFGVNTEDGWALRVKFTTAKEKKPEDKKPGARDKPGAGGGPFGNRGGGSPKPSDGEPDE